jgi:hypothetical protein
MRVSSATSGVAPSASESSGFPAVFAVQLHAKVRGYDARRFTRNLAGAEQPVAVENRPHCGLLARQMLVEGRPMMAGYKTFEGLQAPQPFASSTERLNDQV